KLSLMLIPVDKGRGFAQTTFQTMWVRSCKKRPTGQGLVSRMPPCEFIDLRQPRTLNRRDRDQRPHAEFVPALARWKARWNPAGLRRLPASAEPPHAGYHARRAPVSRREDSRD